MKYKQNRTRDYGHSHGCFLTISYKPLLWVKLGQSNAGNFKSFSSISLGLVDWWGISVLVKLSTTKKIKIKSKSKRQFSLDVQLELEL